jgi:UDP:flavonoid glycosyltransferase YjiC (YdhE family)
VHIAIPVTGSRGDVQPYIALGQGLRSAGHDVTLVSHEDFEKPAREQGLSFWPIGGCSREWHESPTGHRLAGAAGNPFAFLREFARLREPHMAEFVANCSEACRDSDLVLVSQLTLLIGLSVAEKWRLPVCCSTIYPTTLTRFAPFCLFPHAPDWLPFRPLYNYASYLVGGEYLWQLLRAALNRARREVLDLPPLPLLGPSVRLLGRIPNLHGYSACVYPRPADWGPHEHMTGYWFLDESCAGPPPAPLRAFVESGPPPVCVGFGSMSVGMARQTTRLVHVALARTGQRAVLLTGWGGLGDVPQTDRVFVTESAPHDWLFPRAAAVIHHGGAGTTAAGLRAGVPSIAVPFSADQFCWGQRVFRLGVGPRPIPRHRLSVGRLVEALRAALGDKHLRRNAALLGRRIRAERGVDRAVELLRRYAPVCEPPVLTGTSQGRAARRPQAPADTAPHTGQFGRRCTTSV